MIAVVKHLLILTCSVSVLANSQSEQNIPNNNKQSEKNHIIGDKFQNPHSGAIDKSLFKFLKIRFFGDQEWADHVALAETVPLYQAPLIPQAVSPNQIAITWLGHSTFLIQIDDYNILTDPIFSDRASPVDFAGPKRLVPHVIDYSQLPKIDAVVISHNHYDHLDSKSINMLANNTRYHVPLKLGAWFEEHNISSELIHEYDWWQSMSWRGLTIQAMPSQHWSGRGLFDRNKTLWASWLIEVGGQTVWFAGDTGYNKFDFRKIGDAIRAEYGGLDIALIPIGAYEPRSFMKEQHVNPAEAVLIHQEVGAQTSIGMHWGTFPLTAEPPAQPITDLDIAKDAAQLAKNAFITLKIGETFYFK